VREGHSPNEKPFAVYLISVTDNAGRTRNSLSRRYRDFKKLHRGLVKIYSKEKVHGLPPKKLFGNTFDEKFQDDRRQKLETFLNKIAHLEGIWDQQPMKDFLEGEMILQKGIVPRLLKVSSFSKSS